MTPNEQLIRDWNGQPPDHQWIAVDCGDETLYVAAGKDRFGVAGSRLLGFLNSIRNTIIVCEDVGRTHRRIRDLLKRDGSDIGVLRKLVRNQQLIDPVVWCCSLAEVHNDHDPLRRLTPAREEPMLERLVHVAGLLDEAQLHADRRTAQAPFAGGDRRLGLGTIIEGKIAFSDARSFEVRLDDEERAELRALLDRQIRRVIEQIESIPELRRCYYPATGPIKLKKGVPKYDGTRLRPWLEDRIKKLHGDDAHPILLPIAEDHVSIKPEHCRRLVQCAPDLRAWAELEHACRAQQLLVSYTGDTLKLCSRATPRTALPPAESYLVDHRRLKPLPGRRFLVIEFPDLLARSLAAICKRESETPDNCSLLDETRNIVEMLAENLPFQRTSLGDGARKESIRRAIVDWFVYGIGMHWSNQFVRGTINNVCDGEISASDIEMLRTELCQAVPGLGRYISAPLRHFVQRQNPGAALPDGDDGVRRSQTFYHAINAEEIFRLDSALKGCLDQTSIDRLTSLLAPAPYQMFGFLSETRNTPTGRVRYDCCISERTAEFLDTADDVVLRIAYELTEMFEWPVIAYDQRIVALIRDTESAQAPAIKAIASATGIELLESPVWCDVAIANSL